MLEDPTISLNKKRFCIFQEDFKRIQTSEQQKNYNLGIFLTNYQRSYGPPILPEELISTLSKYFSKQTLFCESQEKTLSKYNSNNSSILFPKNLVFDKACEIISESFTQWIEMVIRG